MVLREIVELRRRGFRFIALADDNFYPVSLDDLAMARRRVDGTSLRNLERLRQERFDLMSALSRLPDDMVFFTQITMEAAEDPAFVEAMRRARIRGALIGIEAVTPEGLKDVYKGFNLAGDELVERLRVFSRHGVSVLGSFIFGLPSDRRETFRATVTLAERANLAFAQFVLLTPFPGTLDFEAWAKETQGHPTVDGIPVTRYWLIPQNMRPKLLMPHPTLAAEEIRLQAQDAWDAFYSWRKVWRRSQLVHSLKSRLAFVLISKLYRQMYANTGIATDSARVNRSAFIARLIATLCRGLFMAKPMPDLEAPVASVGQSVSARRREPAAPGHRRAC